MWTAFPPSDYYADSDTPEPISRHRAFPSHHQQPGEHEVSPTFTMIRLTGSEAGSTPTAKPAGTRSIPPVTNAQIHKPGVERAAVDKGGIVTVGDPCPPGFGSFLQSRGFNHRIAFALPFGLASTHAGVWQCRPAVTSSGTLHLRARSRASVVPQLHRAAAPAQVRHSSRHG